jgi:hypothetical protein
MTPESVSRSIAEARHDALDDLADYRYARSVEPILLDLNDEGLDATGTLIRRSGGVHQPRQTREAVRR